MTVYIQGEPRKPLGPSGPIARVEFWLRAHGRLPRLVNFLGWLDERGLRRNELGGNRDGGV
jgi:hypothetical protein